MFETSVKLPLKRSHLNKLKSGKAIQLSHKMLTDQGDVELFLSPPQFKKLSASLRVGKGMRLSFEPAQIAHHEGCGLFTKPIKKMKKAMSEVGMGAPPITTLPIKALPISFKEATTMGGAFSLKKLGPQISRGFKKAGRSIVSVAENAGDKIADVAKDAGKEIADKKRLRYIGKKAIDIGIKSVGATIGSTLGGVAGTMVGNPVLGSMLGSQLGSLATKPLADMAVKKSGLGRGRKKKPVVENGGALFPAGSGGALAPAGKYMVHSGMGDVAFTGSADVSKYLHDGTKDFLSGHPSFYVPYDPIRENVVFNLK